VGLCSLIVFPTLHDIKIAFPDMDAKWLNHDIAYPAMLCKILPVGWMGLMVGGLIAANSSTILTHLNWGASYLVHDFYRRFVNPGRSERHYVNAGRIATVGLFLCAGGMTFLLTSAKDSFDLLLQVGAGTGLIYILRWFWWRINAWCEVVAMVSSFVISAGILVVNRVYAAAVERSVLTAIETSFAGKPDLLKEKLSAATEELAKLPAYVPSHRALILTIAVTTVCWLLAAFLGPQTDRETLVAFYKKVRPFGPGWERIRREAGIAKEDVGTGENIPLALLGWVSGCTAIWSSLFTIGNYLYGRMLSAGILLAVFLVSGSILVWVVNRLWTNHPCTSDQSPSP
jgi:Na+/proline symporter